MTGFTRTFPGAACSNFTSHPQGDPGGGCLIDATQMYSQIQPSQEYYNFFLRGTLNITPAMQGYGEFNWYKNKSQPYTTPSGVSTSVGYPGGPVNNAVTALGPAHPDNPYFGTAARFRYTAADNGPRVNNVDTDFYRVLARHQGHCGRMGLGQRVPLLGKQDRERADGVSAARRRVRAAGSGRLHGPAGRHDAVADQQCCRRGGEQPCLCCAAAGNVLAHRRELRAQLAGALCGLVADDP